MEHYPTSLHLIQIQINADRLFPVFVMTMPVEFIQWSLYDAS